MQHFTYELITFPKDIQEFKAKSQKIQTRVEAKRYFDWVVSIMPNRLEILENQLKQDGIELDYTRDSLVELTDWFYNNIFPGETKLKDLS